MPKHPTQPIELDGNNVVRFRRNLIVDMLVVKAAAGEKWGLNDIFLEVARGRLPVEDYMQFMQLQGYSVSGYGDAAFSHEWKVWRKHAKKMDDKAGQLWAEWNRAGRWLTWRSCPRVCPSRRSKLRCCRSPRCPGPLAADVLRCRGGRDERVGVAGRLLRGVLRG